jgi:hypothetical protein
LHRPRQLPTAVAAAAPLMSVKNWAELHSIASLASASIAGEHVRTERLRDLQVEHKFEFRRRLCKTRRLG